MAFTLPWNTWRNRTTVAKATRFRRSGKSPPRANTSSSSVAATPAPIVSVPRIVRARRACTSWKSCRAPRRHRASDNPWPQCPYIYRIASAHEEGVERLYSVSTKRFIGDDAGRRQGTGTGQSRDGARTRSQHHQGNPGQQLHDALRSGVAGDGFHRPGTPGHAGESRREIHRPRQRVARRQLDDERSRACSPPATCSTASRSSSGPSPRRVRRRAASTSI